MLLLIEAVKLGGSLGLSPGLSTTEQRNVSPISRP
jgi:hypothetical protein